MTEATASAPCCGNCRYSVINGQLGTCHRYARIKGQVLPEEVAKKKPRRKAAEPVSTHFSP